MTKCAGYECSEWTGDGCFCQKRGIEPDVPTREIPTLNPNESHAARMSVAPEPQGEEGDPAQSSVGPALDARATRGALVAA